MSMNVYLGEEGLSKAFQTKEFPDVTTCNHCTGIARIMFVVAEDGLGKSICDLHANRGQGDYWPHDSISLAVYLCKDCFEVTSILEQA